MVPEQTVSLLMTRLVEICKVKSPGGFPAANRVLSFRCDKPSYKCFEGD